MALRVSRLEPGARSVLPWVGILSTNQLPSVRLRYFLTCLLAITLLHTDVLSQDRDDVGHPTSCQHAELAALDSLEGSWTVHGSVRLPDGEWADVKGRAQIAGDLEGCVLFERYEDDRFDGSFAAIAVYSFDAIDGRLQKTWVDSAHGLATLFRGGPVGDKTIFSASKEIRGTTHHFVEEYRFDGPDRFVHERRRATGDRKSWRATSRLIYERK
jgi:hypothetical protein